MSARTPTRSASLGADPACENWYEDRLVCADCRRALSFATNRCDCLECGWTTSRLRPIDLRPRRAVAIESRVVVEPTGPDCGLEGVEVGQPAPRRFRSQLDRDSGTFFAALGEESLAGLDLLDLGCGSGEQAQIATELGLRYVGVDIDSTNADLLADAHRLPFADASFDIVFAYAVLEHLHHPYAACQEIARLARPGGRFVGSVSQGEPFHGSYFHATTWGLLQLLRTSGFVVERVWPSYDTLRALGKMGGYPRILRPALLALAALSDRATFLSPRLRFRSTVREQTIARLARAASLCFVASRRS